VFLGHTTRLDQGKIPDTALEQLVAWSVKEQSGGWIHIDMPAVLIDEKDRILSRLKYSAQVLAVLRQTLERTGGIAVAMVFIPQPARLLGKRAFQIDFTPPLADYTPLAQAGVPCTQYCLRYREVLNVLTAAFDVL
jgi:hypothetical protein